MLDRTIRTLAVLALIAGVSHPLAVSNARAQQPAATAPAAPNERKPIDPKALELVRAMSAKLAGAKNFTVHAEIVYDDVMRAGRKLQFSAALDAAVRRTDGLAVEFLSDRGGKRLWYDGKTVTVLDVLHDAYMKKPAPATTTALLTELETKQGVAFPLADFLADDPAARLLADVQSAFVVGPADVLGTTTTQLAFSTSTLDWQIWIDADGDPLPRKVVITYRDRPSAPQYAAVFSNWEFPRSIEDARFEAELPDDASEVEVVAVRSATEEKP
jgi:hypothetical protein